MTDTSSNNVGLALSGGGSRAMAFHLGLMDAMLEVGWHKHVDVLSTVSGGSVFAAAMLAHAQATEEGSDGKPRLGDELGLALDKIRSELPAGFVKRAIFSLRSLGALWPFSSYGRTERFGEVFDKVFGLGKALGELPEHPRLCMNTTILNNGQVGRLTRGGFSGKIEPVVPGSSYRTFPLDKRWTIGLAAATSAAFPFGLSPVQLKWSELKTPKGQPLELRQELEDHPYLLMTDGGVQENLGVQTLSHSHTFGAHTILLSDAGTDEGAWNPRWFLRGRVIVNIGAMLLTPSVLTRLVLVMNNKQNRTMRELAWENFYPETRGGALFMVRLTHDWRVQVSCLQDFAERRGFHDVDVAEILAGGRAHQTWLAFQERDGLARCNEVATTFGGLEDQELELLIENAKWQVYAIQEVLEELELEFDEL